MRKMKHYSQKRTFFRLIILVGVLAALALGVSSCNLPNLGGLLSPNSPTTIAEAADASPTPSPSATPNVPVLKARTLILWVPPIFDPNSGATAGNLFLSRLDEFNDRRPQTDIQVRVKSLEGQTGMLESLRITESAAPILKPDLIALPRSLMEQAFREGLILPLDDISGGLIENDWFNYALDLSRVDQSTAGFPFAGDLLTLAYKSDTGEDPPPDWDSLIASQKALAFPASDSKSLVSLAFYQSLGSPLLDESGSYILTGESMLEVLSFYQKAQTAGVMPYWLTQFETDQQAWQSYQDRQSTLALSWTSIILGSESPNISLAAMPTKEGKAFSYASGWVWCLVQSDPETEGIAAELAEFLTADSYLADWGKEAGFLPVQPSALTSWSEMPYYATLQKLLPAAVLIPSNDLQAELGPEIRNAVVAVLKDQADPQAALEALLGQIPAP
jgi:ABC-type glycerol-3-phosphate transport system substrate-binding protein